MTSDRFDDAERRLVDEAARISSPREPTDDEVAAFRDEVGRMVHDEHADPPAASREEER